MNKITFETAKEYLDLGWSIIPVNISWNEEKKKYDKKPAVVWKDYQDRLPTEDELHSWFDGGDYTGIGLVTGEISGVVVVDVEKSGLDAIEELHLTSNRISNTISGGKHFFYEWPGKRTGNTVRIEGRDMDFRGDGGFVVIPPSCCVDKGYTWEIECPNWVLPKLPALVSSDWKEVKEPLKITEVLNAEEGTRNDTLYREACSLLGKHSADEAWELLLGINMRLSKPLGEDEVRTLFNSAYSFIDKQTNTETGQENNSPMVGEPKLWADITGGSEKTDWLWENYLAKGRTTLFSALPKAGKSTFLRGLFLAMNKETEFVGQPTKKSNILVLSEESEDEWKDSREGIENEDLGKTYVWSDPTRAIPNTQGWIDNINEISRRCKELKIDLVVIDTITTFWPVEDENDAAKVKRALIPLLRLTIDNGVALMLVHHFRKSGGNEGTAARGSGALAGYVSILMELRRHDDGMPSQRKIKTSGRGVQESELVIELMDDGIYKTLGEPWIVSKTARIAKILSIMEEFKRPVSTKEISNFWNANVCKIDERTIRRYMKELEKDGQVATDRIEIVRSSKVPFYACTGWKSTEREGTDNQLPPTNAPVRSLVEEVIVRSPVRSTPLNSLEGEERTGPSMTGEPIVRGQDYGSEGIPFDGEEPPKLSL